MKAYTVLAILAAALAVAGAATQTGWNPRLAAQYLDARQKAWLAWPPANHSGISCMSCHTGLPYLLARPALRQTIGERDPTLYEAVLIDGVRATALKSDGAFLFGDGKGLRADQEFGAQIVISALVLAVDDAPHLRLSPEGESAFQRLWAFQLRDGENKGAWNWSDFELDPWETPPATFYGAALAAVATGVAPAGYQFRPQIQGNISTLTKYLLGAQKTQPLHNRLAMLWAAAELHNWLSEADRRAILDLVWARQQADGSWSIESLGPWKNRAKAPSVSGSNGYATAWAAFALERAGAPSSDRRLARALDWLKTHQDRESGAWAAESMNHAHAAGSMPALFMQDAATAYAVAALSGGH